MLITVIMRMLSFVVVLVFGVIMVHGGCSENAFFLVFFDTNFLQQKGSLVHYQNDCESDYHRDSNLLRDVVL